MFRFRASGLDTFGVRTGFLQIPKEEQDPVGYLAMLVSRVLPRRALAAVAIRVLAGAQVPLDLALVDQVVVLPFPDDPDTPEKERGSVTLTVTGPTKETAEAELSLDSSSTSC